MKFFESSMDKVLYFVNSIYKPIEGKTAQVTLFSTETGKEQKSIVIEVDRERLTMSNHKGEIREGWFVYYVEGGQHLFRYGNLSFYARKQFSAFKELQKVLVTRYVDGQSDEIFVPFAFQNPMAVAVTSYHVNVGHGNCSLLLLQSGGKFNIWMVDCSVTDQSNWGNYTDNLRFCLNKIASKLHIHEDKPLHIDRFFLTHTHYDHFNGMEYLIDHGHIDRNTLCYMNLYYNWAGKTYLRILEKLLITNVKFVEPWSGNSNAAISFFHPECRLYRSAATIVSSSPHHRIVNSPVNDSSTVIMFNFGGHSMVFTGDLEQEGFNAMTSATKCSPALFKSNYYTISHHGSINGHPDMPCMNPERPMSSPLSCITNKLSKALLMGKKKAYNGIYSPAVVAYWSGLPGVLEITENAPHYLELDWSSGNVTYH